MAHDYPYAPFEDPRPTEPFWRRGMKCPQCNDDCWRDEVDIGIGIQYSPWKCMSCGWYEDYHVDTLIDADTEADIYLEAYSRYREIENLLDDMDIVYIPLTINQHPKLVRLMELLAERREIRKKIK